MVFVWFADWNICHLVIHEPDGDEDGAASRAEVVAAQLWLHREPRIAERLRIELLCGTLEKLPGAVRAAARDELPVAP
jgi:hypothetical protein